MSAAVTAVALPRGGLMAAGALLGGYLLGALPVAWLLLRRARRQAAVAVTGPGRGLRLLDAAAGGPPGTLEVLAAGGPRAALVVLFIELAKGAAAGLGAHLYDPAAWFSTCAIAGCVAGDAFPLGARRGGRGLLPLVSGVFLALPGTWSAGVVVAIPALLVLALSGVALEAVLAVCVPLAFVVGTGDWRTVPPALLIVAVVVARSRRRRLAKDRAVADWRRRRGGIVLDAPESPLRGG